MKLAILLALTLFSVLCFIGLVIGKLDVITVTLIIIIYCNISYGLCGKIRKRKKKVQRKKQKFLKRRNKYGLPVLWQRD